MRVLGGLLNLWSLLLCLSLGILVRKAQAVCSIQDQYGDVQVLDVMPYGVNYYESSDSLECILPNSCRQWTISGCSDVECKNQHSCQDTRFHENEHVSCLTNEACLNAQVIKGKRVTCGGGAMTHNFCKNSVIESDNYIVCEGPNACTADKNLEPRITFKVGAKGQVQCANSSYKAYSCQHLVVEISHGRRACFEKKGDTSGNCAMNCVNHWDCDIPSIQFKVVPK